MRQDAFIACLSGDLSVLHQATYLGGGGDDHPDIERIGSAMAIHPADGTVYVAGFSKSGDLPAAEGAFRATAGPPICRDLSPAWTPG